MLSIPLGTGVQMSGRPTNPAPDMMAKRLSTAVILLGLALNLAGCGGFVADHWPHWAGGLPVDAPPRPGAPGYDEFVGHGQTKPETVSATSPQQPVVAPATASAPVPAASLPQAPTAQIRAAEPADDASENASVVKGGLY
jgi:hypothetical protein